MGDNIYYKQRGRVMKLTSDINLNKDLQQEVQQLRETMLSSASSTQLPARFFVKRHPDKPCMIITDTVTSTSHTVSLYAYSAVIKALSVFCKDVMLTTKKDVTKSPSNLMAYKVSTETTQHRWGYIYNLTKDQVDGLPLGKHNDSCGEYIWSYGINDNSKY